MPQSTHLACTCPFGRTQISPKSHGISARPRQVSQVPWRIPNGTYEFYHNHFCVLQVGPEVIKGEPGPLGHCCSHEWRVTGVAKAEAMARLRAKEQGSCHGASHECGAPFVLEWGTTVLWGDSSDTIIIKLMSQTLCRNPLPTYMKS